MSSLDTSLALFPGFYRVYYERGLAQLQRKDPEAACHDFDEALRLKPDFIPALMQRAVARAERRDFDRAVRDLERVRDLPGSPTRVYFMLARIRTLSLAPDGTAIANHASSLFATLDAQFPRDVWEAQLARAVQTWASVTNLTVGVVADGGQPFGAPGLGQGDARFGDIRVGAQAMAPAPWPSRCRTTPSYRPPGRATSSLIRRPPSTARTTCTRSSCTSWATCSASARAAIPRP